MQSILTRRNILEVALLLGGAQLNTRGALAKTPSGSTVRDCFWLWSHVAGSYNGQYNLPGISRITPVEAAFYLSIPNVFMVELNGRPPVNSLEQFAVPFQSLEQVAWSIVDPQNTTPTSERRAVLDFAFKTPNVTGVVMDDFFVHRKSWKDDQIADLSIEQLHQVRKALQRSGKRLDLWVVLYEWQIDGPTFPSLVPYLELCDVVQVWIWNGKDIPNIISTLDKFEKLLPNKRKVLGCFMWDFGGKKPQPVALMRQQCETGLRCLKEGRIDGIVFAASWLCDRGLEAVSWTRDWIHEVGTQRL